MMELVVLFIWGAADGIIGAFIPPVGYALFSLVLFEPASALILSSAALAGTIVGNIVEFIFFEKISEIVLVRAIKGDKGKKAAIAIEKFVRKYALTGVFFAAITPLLGVATPVAASLKMPLYKYFISMSAGRTLMIAFFAILGYVIGTKNTEVFMLFIIAALIFIIGSVIVFKIIKKRTFDDENFESELVKKVEILEKKRDEKFSAKINKMGGIGATSEKEELNG